MTKDEFIRAYLTASHAKDIEATETGLRIVGKQEDFLVTLPCYCGEEGCQGWAMIDNLPDRIKRHMDTGGGTPPADDD